MSEYGKIVAYIFNLCGNEFVTQLFLVALLFIPALKRRSLFWVRYPLSWAAVIALQHLQRLGIVLIPEALNYILVLALLVGITALCFKADIYQAMFVAVCIYCCQFIISNTAFTTVFALMHLTKNGGNWMYYYIIMPVTMAVLMPLAYLFVVRRIKRSDLLFNSHTIIYIVLAFVLVATTLTCFARKEIFWSLVGQAYLLSISTLFTVSTMLAGFMNLHKRRLEEENVILQQLLHKDKQRYEQAALANEKIQIKYHDMKMYENNGVVDFESLREVEPDSEILRSMYFTGNSALDVILSEKAMMEHLKLKDAPLSIPTPEESSQKATQQSQLAAKCLSTETRQQMLVGIPQNLSSQLLFLQTTFKTTILSQSLAQTTSKSQKHHRHLMSVRFGLSLAQLSKIHLISPPTHRKQSLIHQATKQKSKLKKMVAKQNFL